MPDDLTANERTMLLALALHPGRSFQPGELIAAMPIAFGARNNQNLHQTGVSLARKGLARRSTAEHGRAAYQILPAALTLLGIGKQAGEADDAIAREVAAGRDTHLTVPVRIIMTAGQREAYAREYSLGDDPEGQAAAARDFRDHITEALAEAAEGIYMLREFTSHSVGEPEAR